MVGLSPSSTTISNTLNISVTVELPTCFPSSQSIFIIKIKKCSESENTSDTGQSWAAIFWDFLLDVSEDYLHEDTSASFVNIHFSLWLPYNEWVSEWVCVYKKVSKVKKQHFSLGEVHCSLWADESCSWGWSSTVTPLYNHVLTVTLSLSQEAPNYKTCSSAATFQPTTSTVKTLGTIEFS